MSGNDKRHARRIPVELWIDVEREGYAICERMGTADGFGRFLLGNLTEALFLDGEWSEAEQLAIAGLEHAGRSGGQYHEPVFTFVVGEIGLVRDGRREEAIAAARRVVDLARERGDDQIIIPVFSMAAWLFARTATTHEAGLLVDEVFARRRGNPRGVMAGYWSTLIALTLGRIGRRGALVGLGEPEGSRFLEAGHAVDEARFADAALVLQEIGARPLEAEVRVLAAQGSLDTERHLDRARELLRELGATARLRELDAVSPSRSA